MKIIKPKILHKGATIGLLSISGVLNDDNQICVQNAADFFRKQGYNVVISDSTYVKNNYCSGDAKVRAQALNSFFADDKIDAIVATRGGFGTIQILDDVNYNLIAKKPKIFAGYSDITTLLWMIYKKTGLITFHAPMACPDFGLSEVNKFTSDGFFSTLASKTTCYEFVPSFCFGNLNTLQISGIICPSNLSTLVSLCNFDFYTTDDKILLLEDINEPAYKIDRMLTQLFNDVTFSKTVKAIVLGDFAPLDNKNWFCDIWKKLSQKLNIPIVDGLQFGHNLRNSTIPFGIQALVDFKKNKIDLTQKYF